MMKYTFARNASKEVMTHDYHDKKHKKDTA